VQRTSVIIIKHGFSETCDHSVSPVVSYGDVFRCTCLLEDFKGWNVTWVTAQAARDLLAENHLIDQLVLADYPEQIQAGRIKNHYDMLINLEKQKSWCEFAASLSADQRYGFKDWANTGPDTYYPDSAAALSEGMRRDDFKALQETLFQTIGRQWSGQRYVLGYQPKVMQIYDVGLNYNIGPKWPTKSWPKNYWQQLHGELISRNYSVSWQQSLNSIRHYIDWLASCRLIITCDSLGLHLSLAIKNSKLIALFGPTSPEQIYLYGKGIKITPACNRSCVPCYQARCDFDDPCMNYLSVDMVVDAVEMLIGCGSLSKPVFSDRYSQQTDLITVGG
jgi:heptosyltransferase-2